ncbi:hypothetical protein [Nostoc sp. 'Peltigera membranacea cyanobiont' N6]|uniref:hypothetical protein n=1 Tax=Nostoc sp. 'Peltigera membranacea cyanobiont' N6 TaxID=1261031 RepID=UPI000CF3236D|nr:hypothetical protein [Nostoc sp. 'Peltigera membranacea cyanobiont' N6]AVH64999.1 hypothetical protein NPM_3393 [Nostoc sp. 'Peltigera membranacea cyanobiont' N6]
MFLRFAYIGLSLLSIALSFYLKSKLEGFLQENTAIANEKSLEAYKNLVRLDMYIVLTQIILLFGAFASFITYTYQDFRGVFSLFILGFAVGFAKQIGELEEKARTLDCVNNELESQYKEISHTWQKKALPDF